MDEGDDMSGTYCTHCPGQVWIRWRRVTHNENHNLDRYFAATQGSTTWQPQHSLSLSRNIPSTSTFSPLEIPSTYPTLWSQGPAPSFRPSSQQIQVNTCGVPGCDSKLNQACPNARCKTHCAEIGGCHITNHCRAAEQRSSAVGPTPTDSISLLTSMPPSSQPQLSVPPPAFQPHTSLLTGSLSSSQPHSFIPPPPSFQPHSTTPPTSSASFIPPPPSSQLCSTTPLTLSAREAQCYTQLHADAAESQRQQELKRTAVRQELDKAQESTKQVNSTVMVMTWLDSTEPIPFEVQGEVIDGNFVIDHQTLCRAGIEGTQFHYYHHGMQCWLAGSIPHVVKVNSPQQLCLDGVPVLLLRDISVKECDGLNSLLRPTLPLTSKEILTKPRSITTQQKDLSKELEMLTIAQSKQRSTHPEPLSSTSIHNQLIPKGKRNASKSLSPEQPIKKNKVQFLSPSLSPSSSLSLSPSSSPSTSPQLPVSTSSTHLSVSTPSTHPSTFLPTPSPPPVSVSPSLPPSTIPLQVEVIEITSSPESSPSPSPVKHEPASLTVKKEPASPTVKKEPTWSPHEVIVVDDSLDDEQVPIQRDWPEKTFEDAKVTDKKGWPRSTYYLHKQWWDSMTHSTRQRYLDAGRTDDGLWSKFMAEVNAPKAEVRAARQRMSQQKRRDQELAAVSDDDGDDSDDFVPSRHCCHGRFVKVPSEGEEEEDQLVDDDV
ncbi:hypothetical protein K435DRAFT_848528 [Dendrothele bispora CBS 962.96]|uniref:Uncharacterized protein n=1 Tax=Dendrothele bispora (strain CBS 962.96) TaxID=1314807 RepID=A0A4S8MVR6_DENBC|nr:hypothetical protein K435DRAFT_848528 [Dendrothele bispora CBS 962.96]